MGNGLCVSCLPRKKDVKRLPDSPSPRICIGTWGIDDFIVPSIPPVPPLGPHNLAATPLPKPKRSRFEGSIWQGRSCFSLQVCSDLHLEFYQPELELPVLHDSYASVKLSPATKNTFRSSDFARSFSEDSNFIEILSHPPNAHQSPILQHSTLERTILNRKAARNLFHRFLNPGRARYLALLGDIGNPGLSCYGFFLRWCSKSMSSWCSY